MATPERTRGKAGDAGSEPVDDALLREDLRERRTVFEGRLLTLHVDVVETAGRGTASREVVDHPGAVGIVALDAEGRILLVRQWRHAVGRALWEIPAGTLGRGEPPEAAARRELAEETGFTARRWQALGTGPVAPGYSGEILHLFAASDLVIGEAHTDPDEEVVARLFDPGEIRALAAEDGLDIKTFAGLWFAGLAPPARSTP
jgi:ADP-ribose pyrophosphatase